MTYWSLKRQVKAEIIKSKYPIEKATELMPRILEQLGLRVQIENEVYRLHNTASKSQEFVLLTSVTNYCCEIWKEIPSIKRGAYTFLRMLQYLMIQ